MLKTVAIWIDHKEARIFHIQHDRSDETTVMAPLQSIHHKHPKGAEGVREHPDDARRFFHNVTEELRGTEEILVVGPSTAKLEFVKHVHHHDHALGTRIIGVETVDHPSDGQVVAYARKYFKDREVLSHAPGVRPGN